MYALASEYLALLEIHLSNPAQSGEAAAFKAAIERSADVRRARARFEKDSAGQAKARKDYVADCEEDPCPSTYFLLRGEARLNDYSPRVPPDPLAAELVVRALDRYRDQDHEETRLWILQGVMCADEDMHTAAGRAAFQRCVNDASPRVRERAFDYARGIPKERAVPLLSSLTNHPNRKAQEEAERRLRKAREK